MKAKAHYRDAQGRGGQIDDLDQFLTHFDRPDADFWIGQTGDVGIWRAIDGSPNQEMLLSYIPDAGFTIDVEDSGGKFHIAWRGADNTPVIFYVGGGRETRPRRAFVTPDDAKSIVRHFIVSGTLSNKVGWTTLSGLSETGS